MGIDRANARLSLWNAEKELWYAETLLTWMLLYDRGSRRDQRQAALEVIRLAIRVGDARTALELSPV